LTNVVL